MPDVLALSADGYQAMGKWRGPDDLLRPDPALPATHYRDGVVAIDAPGVRRGGQLSADLHDMAPTVLAMLGLRVPDHMQGRVLHDAFESDLPVRYGARPVVASDPQADAPLVAAGFGAAYA